jgi:hypothetical protein
MKDLKTIITEKIGEASMCLSETKKKCVLTDSASSRLVDEIMDSIQLAIINAYDYARTICDIESGQEYYNKNYNNKTNKQMKDLKSTIEIKERHISILEPGSEAAVLFEAAKPLMKLLNDKYHPHCTIIVNHGNVQVYEGICSTGFTNEFMND